MNVLAAPVVSDVVEVTEASVVQSQTITDQTDVVRPKEESPQVSTCLVDTDAEIGMPVVLEAIIKGRHRIVVPLIRYN